MLLLKTTRQQLKLNWQCNNKFLFKYFKASKHASCFFSVRFNWLYDVIMLPGAINAVFH